LNASGFQVLAFKVGISLRELLISALYGLLGAAAYPPLGLFPFSLVSIVLFLTLIRERSPADARQVGFLYGFFFALGTMYWLFGIFGIMAVALVGLMALYFALLAMLIAMTDGTRCPHVRRHALGPDRALAPRAAPAPAGDRERSVDPPGGSIPVGNRQNVESHDRNPP